MAILKGLAFTPIAFGLPDPRKPGEDPPQHVTEAKSVQTGALDWTAAASYVLDPTQSNQLLEMKNIQSLFIDNYATTGTTLITVAGTNQLLRIPPKGQGYFQLLAGDRPVITFTNTSGNGASSAWLMNTPIAGAVVWTLP